MSYTERSDFAQVVGERGVGEAPRRPSSRDSMRLHVGQRAREPFAQQHARPIEVTVRSMHTQQRPPRRSVANRLAHLQTAPRRLVDLQPRSAPVGHRADRGAPATASAGFVADSRGPPPLHDGGAGRRSKSQSLRATWAPKCRRRGACRPSSRLKAQVGRRVSIRPSHHSAPAARPRLRDTRHLHRRPPARVRPPTDRRSSRVASNRPVETSIHANPHASVVGLATSASKKLEVQGSSSESSVTVPRLTTRVTSRLTIPFACRGSSICSQTAARDPRAISFAKYWSS